MEIKISVHHIQLMTLYHTATTDKGPSEKGQPLYKDPKHNWFLTSPPYKNKMADPNSKWLTQMCPLFQLADPNMYYT